jgi:hypothetical protein
MRAAAGPKRDDYGRLKRYLEGKGRYLPEGLTSDDLHGILLIINYGITPTGGNGWPDLPVGVATWLFPVQTCLNRISEENARASQQ